MQFKKGEWFVLLFNLAYIVAFTIYYASMKNWEFLGYIAVLVFFFALILGTLKKTKFDYLILWGLSIWGFLHMIGGGIRVNDAVLYKYIFFNFFTLEDVTILRYDHVVHFFGFFMATLVVNHLLNFKLKSKEKGFIIYFVIVTAGMGLGALNEIVEFAAAMTVESGVGGYVNNSLDLVFNTLGALCAALFVHLTKR